MHIGLIDVDGHNFPNLALMKLSAWHKSHGDIVEWYSVFEPHYDIVYMSKVFTHTKDYGQAIQNAARIVKGGTGYDVTSTLPEDAEKNVPDYSLYPYIDSTTAYGFLTRGCIRKCPWCVVPRKEGSVHPYQDVDEIAINGRTNLVLMDNNILAAGDYGIAQLEKIAERGYRVDFNQAMDARLVTKDIASILARIRWMKFIRFGCDTPGQVKECERAIELLRAYGCKKQFGLYTMIYGDIKECAQRIGYWRGKFDGKVLCFAQPYIDFTTTHQNVPQWQKDMARWANRAWLYKSIMFEDYEPRRGFKCAEYFTT